MTPYQKSITLNFTVGNGFTTDYGFSLPPGKRLVIEWIAATQSVPPGVGCQFGITTQVGGEQAFHALAVSSSKTVDGNYSFVASLATRIYADAGSVIHVSGSRSLNQGSQYGDFSISGYLENA